MQHSSLVSKLADTGLHHSVTNWVKSYLSNRVQRVLANGTYSQYITIKQGVPQGSILGPLFYIVYANDLTKILRSCNSAYYADDTVLYTAHTDFSTSVSKMQKNMLNLEDWCRSNGVTVNTDKTNIMVLVVLFASRHYLTLIFTLIMFCLKL